MSLGAFTILHVIITPTVGISLARVNVLNPGRGSTRTNFETDTETVASTLGFAPVADRMTQSEVHNVRAARLSRQLNTGQFCDGGF
jgi:hypothetical protein